MSRSRYFGAHFPLNYQYYIIDFLNRNEQSINGVTEIYASKSIVKSSFEYSKQLVIIVLIQSLFNFVPCQTYTFFNNGYAPQLKKYIEKISGNFPGRTPISKKTPILFKIAHNQIETLLSALIDDFYQTIGDSARDLFKKTLKTESRRMEPPNEVFIGFNPPSELLSSLNPLDRAKLMPYFNAMQYQSKEKITSIQNLLGSLKKTEIVDNKLVYTLAGTLGFVMGVPEEAKFYTAFRKLEEIFGIPDAYLDYELIHAELVDLKVQSIDGSNVPVDKRDKTATNGTGSRGAFFGQKTSICADANCIPLFSQTSTGRTSDITLFYPTFDYVYSMMQGTDQEMWVMNLDAGYSSTYVIEYLEARNIVPFVDLNSRQSKRLKQLKLGAYALQELSKKAIQKGLSKKERKEYLIDLGMYRKKNDLGYP